MEARFWTMKETQYFMIKTILTALFCATLSASAATMSNVLNEITKTNVYGTNAAARVGYVASATNAISMRITDAEDAITVLELALAEGSSFYTPPYSPYAWFPTHSLTNANGSNVSYWPDASGGGRHGYQNTEARKPLFGYKSAGNGTNHPTLYFGGSHYITFSNLNLHLLNTNMTIYVVYRSDFDEANTKAVITADSYIGTRFQITTDRDQHSIASPWSPWYGGNTMPNTPTVFGFAYEPLHYIRLRQNGVGGARVSWSLGLGMTNNLTVGYAGGGSYWAGWVWEIIIYNRALTTEECVAVETYIDRKFNRSGPKLAWWGDSITRGYSATGGSNYPAQTIRLLGGTNSWQSGNASSDGLTLIGVAGATGIENGYRGTLNQALKPGDIAIGLIGCNDIDQGGNPTSLFTNYLADACSTMRKAGAKVIIGTLLPRTSQNADYESDRTIYNNLIRAHWRIFADGIIDFAADARIGGTSFTNSIYCADGVHPNNAGYAVMAELAAPVIANLRAPGTRGFKVFGTNETAAFTVNETTGALTATGVATANSFAVAGTTNQVKFGATNGVPTNAATIVKWISVQVGSETNAYRLPLYE
jgi:lysophospholipase L1-like esterase